MRSNECQTFEQANDRVPAFEETHNDRIGCRSSADASSWTEQSGVIAALSRLNPFSLAVNGMTVMSR